MSSSNAFGVHDHAAQFRGVRGRFLCAEGFGISSKCCFMALSLLHEGGGRESGREGASDEASKPASMQRDVRRSNKENEQETQELLLVYNKNKISSNKKIHFLRCNKKIISSNKFFFIFFVVIKNYFRPINVFSFSSLQ